MKEVKCLFPEKNGPKSRLAQKSIQETPVNVNDKVLKTIIDENGQTRVWLNLAALQTGK